MYSSLGHCPRFRQLVELNFIAAMTPSAGRPQITSRYLRPSQQWL